MSWLNGLSREERTELFLDACAAYNNDQIGEKEFIETLAKLGYNATDIEDLVKSNVPTPPENSSD